MDRPWVVAAWMNILHIHVDDSSLPGIVHGLVACRRIEIPKPRVLMTGSYNTLFILLPEDFHITT